MSQKLSKKIFNLCMISVIIVFIFFTALILMLRYRENGETNMPFGLSKISIVSTIDGKDNEDSANRWNLNVTQNNDIYLYISKNENYTKTEIIKNITITNIQIQKPQIGEIKIYKPSQNENAITKNVDENIASEIVFVGDSSTNIRNLKISNQGGVIAFRCANINVGNFISNDEESLEYKNLLTKLNVDETDLKARICFDIIIELNSGKKYKAESVEVILPVDGIKEKGTTSLELTDLDTIIFKRVKN